MPRFALFVAVVLATGLVAGQTARGVREDAYRANNVGVALLEQYNHADAVKSFQRARELDPSLTLAKINLAIALYYVPEIPAATTAARRSSSLRNDAVTPSVRVTTSSRRDVSRSSEPR